MKKLPRIILNLLLPPGIAVSVVLGPVAAYSGGMPSWPMTIAALGVAYGFAAIPSIVHTIVMERFYRRGLLPSQRKAIGISSFSGMFAGLLVLLTIATLDGRFSDLEKLWFYPIWGLVTGAITALIILLIDRKKSKAPNQTAQTTPGLRPSVSDL